MPRKKPYSGKQKKQQLKDKRNKKGSSDHRFTRSTWQKSATNSEDSDEKEVAQSTSSTTLTTQHQGRTGEYNPERYRLNFSCESRAEIENRKYEAQTVPIQFVPEKEQEADIKEIYRPGSELDMPKRPSWSYKMSKAQLESRENAYFQKYLKEIYKNFGDKHLSYFEHNLETWRQLWRVLEMSDVVVMVTDVRHPVLHFSPALYDHVVEELKKPLILVLNKIDLVPASVAASWTSYFKELFPHLHIVWFTSFPSDTRRLSASKSQTSLAKRLGPKKRIYTTQIGPKELLSICKGICGDKVDMSSWEEKIENDLSKLGFSSSDTSPAHHASSGDAGDMTVGVKEENPNGHVGDGELVLPLQKEPFENGILTVGFVGHPNVGKSSLMNGLIGRKVVSTSVTPGHTKYFQTYFLTKTVRLCDSPGLVFPSLIDKQLQVLSGIYPVSQVREPYTPVGYLASRLNLVNILRLKHPTGSKEWTPWDVCEGWANQRNYKTAKAARPDVYRAANSILRMAVDGRLCMYMRPPGFTEHLGVWEQHENTIGLLALRTTGHFHGIVPCDAEGRHLHLEDFVGYSSDSIADSNSLSGFSEDSDPEDNGSGESDADKTLDQDDFDAMSNQFSVLAMMENE